MKNFPSIFSIFVIFLNGKFDLKLISKSVFLSFITNEPFVSVSICLFLLIANNSGSPLSVILLFNTLSSKVMLYFFILKSFSDNLNFNFELSFLGNNF